MTGSALQKIGVIGGSGLYEIPGLTISGREQVSTPYGTPSDRYLIGNYAGREIVFLARHGSQHSIPPHKINCRANIHGFRQMGVSAIISVNAVGGISKGLLPGTIVVPDQIIDMTRGRDSTFHDDNAVHVDFTEPFCHELRECIFSAGQSSGIGLAGKGTYVCVNGPRLETKAEIQFFSSIDADIVGMTLMPEAVLAREAEICFACIAVVTNRAAGITENRLTVTEVKDVMSESTERVKMLLNESFCRVPEERTCFCKDACAKARM
jgi:5'-methylthioadenosine phosphorylase